MLCQRGILDRGAVGAYVAQASACVLSVDWNPNHQAEACATGQRRNRAVTPYGKTDRELSKSSCEIFGLIANLCVFPRIKFDFLLEAPVPT